MFSLIKYVTLFILIFLLNMHVAYSEDSIGNVNHFNEVCANKLQIVSDNDSSYNLYYSNLTLRSPYEKRKISAAINFELGTLVITNKKYEFYPKIYSGKYSNIFNQKVSTVSKLLTDLNNNEIFNIKIRCYLISQQKRIIPHEVSINRNSSLFNEALIEYLKQSQGIIVK